MTIDDQTPRLSVVVPLFNEIDNLDRLVAESVAGKALQA